MSTAWEPVIGDTEATQYNPGEPFSCVLRYLDDAGDPRDPTDAVFTVTESLPSAIAADFTFSILSVEEGTVLAQLSAADAAVLTRGRTNYFRVKAAFADTHVEVSPRIWIQVT